MADPLSVASGVAGLVSLGLTLCNGLHNYFSAIKDRYRDIETATQSLALLQSNICIIQSSTLKLGHRHTLAANGVNTGLKNCETQLKALEEFIQNLIGAENSSGTYQKWQKQKMFVRYPFDQKKLFQLQEHLSRVNTTLSSFVQSFNLDINIGISDDLQVLKRDLHDNDSTTHSMLKVIASQLNTINLISQPNNMMEVTTYLAQIGGQATAASNNPGPTKPLYMRNSEAEQDLCRNYSAMNCKCPNFANYDIYNDSRHSYQMWGGLIVSKQTSQPKQHRPGCHLYASSYKGPSKTTLTCIGLRYMFSRFVAISLTQDFSAGAFSLSLGLRTCNVVPAGLTVDIIVSALISSKNPFFSLVDISVKEFWVQETSREIIKQLRTAYESGVASPFDVDLAGNNIAHQCIEKCMLYLLTRYDSQSNRLVIKLICTLLSSLFDIGVPVTTPNFYQGTVLDPIIENPNYLWALPRLYSLITNRDPGFCGTELAYSDLDESLMADSYWLEQLELYSKHLEISEAIGFDATFLAIIGKDEASLQGILQDPNFDIMEHISRKDLYGRTLLHIVVSWPTGLSLILEHNPLLLSQHPFRSYDATPLDFALVYSGMRCNASDHSTLCHNCDCSLPAQLLLEADCSVVVGPCLSDALNSCSLRAGILFLKHLRNRRERLRDASIAYLPADIVNRYVITSHSLPDGIAEYLWRKLMEHSRASNPPGISLSQSLPPYGYLLGGWSLFTYPLPTELADLALQFGFQPSDEHGLSPLLSRFKFRTEACGLERAAAYTNWLYRHTVQSSLSSSNIPLTVYHVHGAQVGAKMRAYRVFTRHSSASLLEFKTLLSKICSSNNASFNPCPCVSEPFHRPLAYLMSGLTRDPKSHYSSETISQCLRLTTSVVDFIQTAVPDFEAAYLARCAAHMLTVRFLGIRHFPMCGDYWPCEERVGRDPGLIEEWSEIVEEDRTLVEQLSNLDLEFEEEFKRRNESVTDFLSGYWWSRMEEVQRDMERPLSVDERRGFLDIGVILDDETDNYCDPDSE